MIRIIPLIAAGLVASAPLAAQEWRVHEMTRPRPATAPSVPTARADRPPPGAVVLFNGTDLSRWRSSDSLPARWIVGNGYFEARPGTGTLTTVDSFGDMQLHLEWAAPAAAKGAGQDRGNSGVFLMGRYELQILDSWQNDTYSDGQAGSMYGQHPPLYNAALAPGAWQRYDVFFRRPRFGAAGELTEPARVTVLHNGVPVQNNVVLRGPTTWLARAPYEAHPDRLPFGLQDHGHAVRFRNIWVRPLPEGDAPPSPLALRPFTDAERQSLAGRYGSATVADSAGRLWLDLGDGAMPLVATQSSGFSIEGVDAAVEFERGEVNTLVLTVGGVKIRWR